MLNHLDYKVFIPCAGIGSRLGLKYNKSLVTVGQKPAIYHIIQKFPPDVEIIIALGHDGDNVKQVVDLLFPDRKITYVEIDPYEGEGSGLGRTLLQCSSFLQSPFVFCPCDTIVEEKIPTPLYNWMGIDDCDFEKSQPYRKVDIADEAGVVGKCVVNISPKHIKTGFPYVGLCGIYNYKEFWQAMEEGQEVGSIESGEVYGLK